MEVFLSSLYKQCAQGLRQYGKSLDKVYSKKHIFSANYAVKVFCYVYNPSYNIYIIYNILCCWYM